MSDLEKVARECAAAMLAAHPECNELNRAAGFIREAIERATERMRSELEQVRVALDNVGCPIGNEHKSYTQPERIAGLGKSSQYFMAQTDQLRTELAEARRDKSQAIGIANELAQESVVFPDRLQEIKDILAAMSAQTKEAR